MVKIEDVEVMGMRKAIKGMRNALNSWDKSDSGYMVDEKLDGVQFSYFKIGEKDMELCKNLIKAGSPDRKFMRMIHVQADVTAPLYWWKEFDTYKVGTVANSCSTMHTLHKRDETLFSIYHQRKCHKLNEWVEFCKWIETLPYMKEFLGLDEQVEKEKRELP